MQHVKPDSEQLADLCRQLQQALDSGNWDDMAKTNLAIRELLPRLPVDSELGTPARQLKQRLKSLHAEGLKKCRAECDRLKDVLSSHTEYAEGRAAYMQIDSFGGESS